MTPEYMEMDDIKRTYRRNNGGHWFEPDTMRFFSSRLGSYGYKGASGKRVYFVSSEQFVMYEPRYHKEPRRYTVRIMDLGTGEISEAGEFQQYASRSGADKAARRAAEQDKE